MKNCIFADSNLNLTDMKKKMLLLTVMVCASMMILNAQNNNVNGNKSRNRTQTQNPYQNPRMSSTYIKDPCNGSRLNFGITFGQDVDWMYDHTEEY